MNFYDVLAAEKWGGGIPTTNFFDLLFAQYISGEQWQIYEGTLPATINANGDDMRQYQIYGNTGGVGDRTTGSNVLQSSEIEQGGWSASTGTVPQKIVNPRRCRSKNIYSISSEKIFYDFKSLNVNIAFVNSDGISLGGAGFKTGAGSVDVPANAVKCLFIIANTDTDAGITPAQVIAAGIWASVDGTTPSASFVPFGYEVDMSVKSANLFDKNAKNVNNGYMPNTYLKSDGSASSSSIYEWYVTEYINISGYDALYCNVVIGSVKTPAICFYDSEKNYISGEIYNNRTNFSVAVPQNAVYCRASVNGSPDEDSFMIAPGSTPIPYQPYSNTTTPIYIGDEPLDKDEYVDYQSQKVYRMINGTLTPTDPPVALPALPTVEGITIVDYAGESVAQPEKVYFEYKGGTQS